MRPSANIASTNGINVPASLSAFLSAELNGKVYMRQPEGFHECGDDGNELVYVSCIGQSTA